MAAPITAPTRPGPTLAPSVSDLVTRHRDSTASLVDTAEEVMERIDRRGDDGTWITVADPSDVLARARALMREPDPGRLPLYGVPFGVKDSIDVAGYPTTLACPDYGYPATATAPAVQRLLDAGAVFVGKTNLDQFATGLNGTRTPGVIPRSVYGGELISGGSSSGSALAVALGEVPFAVATDTAGSGRVPPALNGIMGFKPSRGLIPTVGLVPACRSLDCLSLIAGRVTDLATVFDVVAGRDDRDPYARDRRRDATPAAALRIGLPATGDLEFFGDTAMRDAHLAARNRVERDFPRVVTAPLGPFTAAGELLYSGPWVAERLAEFGGFLDSHPESVLPVIRAILESGRGYSAVDVFRAEHRLFALRTEVARLFERMDVLVLPTLGTTFTVDEVLADPIATNTVLGHYTHFGNLLDLCAVAVPAGHTADGRPAGLMILGPALADDRVLAVAAALAAEPPPPAASPGPADADPVVLVVVGHHLSGQPRSVDLVNRGAVLQEQTTTAAAYRLLRTGGDTPGVPVLVADPAGVAIAVETWTVPAAALPAVLAGSAPDVALGRVQLADGRVEIGFVADPSASAGPVPPEDISAHGGWRAYLAQR
ncbi:allophanate hydrolase [Nakamurella deserti]|uniref:allophanate hydrolase n=1 Tax=Nakamurella deserti TaxID=2164074 RepID=UPI001478D5D8|nr:allophanate hydrolase [Nakamurella deserti]